MANFDFVMPYDARMEAWLSEQEYPHPRIGPLNRFPTKEEIFEAVMATGTLEVQCADEVDFFVVERGTKPNGAYQIRIGCSNWDQLGTSENDSFTMHGFFKTELELLKILSHKCGQLLLYPDTGSPAVIVHPGMDVEMIEKLWDESHDQQDPWRYFYERIWN